MDPAAFKPQVVEALKRHRRAGRTDKKEGEVAEKRFLDNFHSSRPPPDGISIPKMDKP